MIMPSDRVYKQTKQIMLGKKSMKPEFKPLADWVDSEFGVTTINIYYNTFTNSKGKFPRLQLIFRTDKEANSFHVNGQFTNYDSKKQSQITKKFKQTLIEQGLIKEKKLSNLLNKSGNGKYLTDDIWVITSAFEPIAKTEANGNIPEEKINELKKNFNNKDLWEISRGFSITTFFLYTEEQLKKYENSKIHKEWTDKYFELLSQYDKFRCFQKEHFSILLDSKENFDKNYESSWFYYYK